MATTNTAPKVSARTCFIAQELAESLAEQYIREETQAYRYPENSPLFCQGMAACRVIQALAQQWGIADRVYDAIQTCSYSAPYKTQSRKIVYHRG